MQKDDSLFWLLGGLDELNSTLGIAISHITQKYVKLKMLQSRLSNTQKLLFSLGAATADMTLRNSPQAKTFAAATLQLEAWIDETNSALPALQNFILPGGAKLGSSLHYCRAVCRRVERDMVSYVNMSHTPARKKILHSGLSYLNRLSDWLFVAAREANMVQKHLEEKWAPASRE